MKTTIMFHGEPTPLRLRIRRYAGSDRIAVTAEDVDPLCPLGKLTINDPDADIADDEIIVKEFSENASWVPQVLANFPDNFIDTGKRVQCGFAECRVFKLVPWE